MSIYALNYLSENIFRWCVNKGRSPLDIDSIAGYIAPLGEFDWHKDSSPFAYLGGGKGVRKAHDVLLAVLTEKGIEEAAEEMSKRK